MADSIVHFEIHASDIHRAVKFYSEIFGWKIEKWGDQDYWVIYAGRSEYAKTGKVGIDGGLLLRKGDAPVNKSAVNAFVCTIEIDDIDNTITKVLAAGGSIALQKQPMAGIGWLAYCKDTEGNIFGLMQTKTDEA